jgi:hypothetical protein
VGLLAPLSGTTGRGVLPPLARRREVTAQRRLVYRRVGSGSVRSHGLWRRALSGASARRREIGVIRRPATPVGTVTVPAISSPLTVNSPVNGSPEVVMTLKCSTSPPTRPSTGPEPRVGPRLGVICIVPLTFGPSCSRSRMTCTCGIPSPAAPPGPFLARRP